MESFIKLTSKAIPIPLNDIDTDMIIPAQFLTSTDKDGYGENLFKRLRQSDPRFPLNDPKYKNSQILISRKNFGCGSSREAAVWALLQYGIKVVIAESFADIFYNNSLKNGLVLVKLNEAEINELLKKAKNEEEISIDLQGQTVDKIYNFPFDPFRKECILNGYDEMDYLLAHTKA